MNEHAEQAETGSDDARLLARESERVATGIEGFDRVLRGGLTPVQTYLVRGDSGAGTTTLAMQFGLAGARRGERVLFVSMCEPEGELRAMARSHGWSLDGVVIDSLAGYVHAMPNERPLTLPLHELLSYLSQQGVIVLLVMAQQGLPNTPRRAPFDLSYISDSVILFHLFEYAGELHKAISMYKRRCGSHEQTLRPLQFGPQGISLGNPLRQYAGILTGTVRLREKGCSSDAL